MQPCHRPTHFRHGFFSTDSPMLQIASSTCTSFHGLTMFQTFHSMWNESDFRPGGGIRCKYLKTKACIEAWMETRMSSTSCAAALLVDWDKAIREKNWHKWIAVRQSHHLCPRLSVTKHIAEATRPSKASNPVTCVRIRADLEVYVWARVGNGLARLKNAQNLATWKNVST